VLSSLCCSAVIMLYCYCVATVIICVVLCIDCVTVPLPPGVNPIAVDKYIYLSTVLPFRVGTVDKMKRQHWNVCFRFVISVCCWCVLKNTLIRVCKVVRIGDIYCKSHSSRRWYAHNLANPKTCKLRVEWNLKIRCQFDWILIDCGLTTRGASVVENSAEVN
jgi:hypothetical protein